MGRIVKQISEESVKYYWYPGDKKEWLRAATALGSGAAVVALIGSLTKNWLAAVTAGTSVAAALGGFNLGRRDARALTGFPDPGDRAARRAAIVHTGRAAWRGLVEGVGGAAAAVLVVNMAQRGVLADWLLPLVPAAVGALAHQAGMLYERASYAAPARAAAPSPAGAETLRSGH
jgi:hypothetical protein